MPSPVVCVGQRTQISALLCANGMPPSNLDLLCRTELCWNREYQRRRRRLAVWSALRLLSGDQMTLILSGQLCERLSLMAVVAAI